MGSTEAGGECLSERQALHEAPVGGRRRDPYEEPREHASGSVGEALYPGGLPALGVPREPDYPGEHGAPGPTRVTRTRR